MNKVFYEVNDDEIGKIEVVGNIDVKKYVPVSMVVYDIELGENLMIELNEMPF